MSEAGKESWRLLRARDRFILVGCCVAAGVLCFVSGCSKPKRQPVDTYLDGVVFRELGQNDMAIKALQAAIAEDPCFGPAYSELGKTYYATGDYRSAVQMFTRAVQLETWSFDDVMGLAQAYDKLGKTAEAAEVYARAAELDAQSFDAQLRAAQCYLKVGQPLRAMVHCQAAQRINETSLEALLLLGRIHEAQKDYASAVAAFEEVAALEPNDPNVMLALGQGYVRAGKYEQAERVLTSLLAAEPKRSEALRDLAFCRVRQGKLDEAITLYGRAIDADHEDWQACNGMGVVCLMKARAGERKYQEIAVQQWRQSLKVNPDQPKRPVLERLIRDSSAPLDLSLGDPNT
jgi:tetratricopeptide (TPR) repeat protein